MNPTDYQICQDIITNLSSPALNHKYYNYLFLAPVNTTDFPTYKTIITRPMDLGTIFKLLKQQQQGITTTTTKSTSTSCTYRTREECYKDIVLIFENAERFHRDRKETGWIVKVSKEMIRLFNKERKRAEKKYLRSSANGVNGGGGSSGGGGGGGGGVGSSAKKPSLKLKLGKKSSTTADTTSAGSTAGAGDNVSSSNGGGETSTKKPAKLKLSLKKSSTAGTSAASASDQQSQPTPKERKRKRKSSPTNTSSISSNNTSSTTPTSNNDNNAPPPPPPPSSSSSKPKMKLTLKTKKDKDSNSSTTPTSSTSSSNTTIPTPTNTTTSKSKLSFKITLNRKSTGGVGAGNTPIPTTTTTTSSSSSNGKSSSSAKKKNMKKDSSTTNAAVTAISTAGMTKTTTLSSSSSTTSSSTRPMTPSNTPSGTATTKTTSTKKSLSISLSGKNRGKELPKGVVAKDSKVSTNSTTTTSTTTITKTTITKTTPKSPKSSLSISETNTKKDTKKNKETTKSNIIISTTTTSTQQQQQQQQQPVVVVEPPKKKIRLSLGSSKNKSTSTTTSTSATASNVDSQKKSQSLSKSTTINVSTTRGGNTSPKGGNHPKVTTPKTITTTTTTTTTPSSSKTTILSTTTTTPSTTLDANNVMMTIKFKAQCFKVLSALKQREQYSVDFVKPVISTKVNNNQKLNDDYRAKIPFPMDLGTMNTKLDKNQYKTVSSFAHDIRRIFANCLRFNDTASNHFRTIAFDMLSSSEDFLHLFLGGGGGGGGGSSSSSSMGGGGGSNKPSSLYPKLLYCWKNCLQIINDLLKLKNPPSSSAPSSGGGGGQESSNTNEDPFVNFPTVHFFLHPVSFFMGGKFNDDYLEKVKQPMDLGTITSKLCEGVYQDVQSFVSDCRLVPMNCKLYYGKRDDGKPFVEQACRLEEVLNRHLNGLLAYDISVEGRNARKRVMMNNNGIISLVKPPKVFFTSMLTELRQAKYTDKLTKMSEPATTNFEYPVNPTAVPDYSDYVKTPMAFQTIDQKIEADSYQYPEDFEYDVILIFKNCETYNLAKRNNFIIQRSKYCAKVFRKMYTSRMKAFIASDGKKLFGEEKKDRKRVVDTSSSVSEQPPTKKAKVVETTHNGSSRKSMSNSVKVATKSISRKSPLTTDDGQSQPTTVQPARSKSPKPTTTTKKAASRASTKSTPIQDAIVQIKKGFTLRESKTLQYWEDGCYRFLSTLKRHTWLGPPANPKFIFHVPVPVLFPNIKADYEAKIRNPMDLTTAECKLLQGGIYNEAEEFINDVALVFANAVQFNRAGHEEGEPMSCAYFDASNHLLRYSRWLSLETLSPYLKDDSHSEGEKQTGALTFWKLTTSNRRDAIEEMETTMMNVTMDKSEEGDRYTWMENECDKLLKALRHQSDLKHMTYFIQTKYPADYLSYVSEPMDWAKCQKRLQSREYNTFGETVRDLRLIFSNALKYNARHKEIDSESGRISARAYDSAQYMSEKLEVAISRMLLFVSDRLNRDMIDQQIQERETEAAERAEMEEKKRMMRENSRAVGESTSTVSTSTSAAVTTAAKQRSSIVHTVNITAPKKINSIRRHYDAQPTTTHRNTEIEELMHHKYVEQKETEKATQVRDELTIISRLIGGHVYYNLSERQNAIRWSKDMVDKILKSSVYQKAKATDTNKLLKKSESGQTSSSMVASLLEDDTRSQIKITIGKNTKRKSKKRKKRMLILE